MNGQLSGIIMIIVLFALMYFLMIRPQKKRQRKHSSMLKTLHKGDKVVTIGRLHGVIDSINRDQGTVSLNCDGIYLMFDLNAIASVKGSNDDSNNKKSAGKDAKKSSAKSTASKDKSKDNK